MNDGGSVVGTSVGVGLGMYDGSSVVVGVSVVGYSVGTSVVGGVVGVGVVGNVVGYGVGS
jgi:hypothetical protein